MYNNYCSKVITKVNTVIKIGRYKKKNWLDEHKNRSDWMKSGSGLIGLVDMKNSLIGSVDIRNRWIGLVDIRKRLIWRIQSTSNHNWLDNEYTL